MRQSDYYEPRVWTHRGRPQLHRMGVDPVDGQWMNEPDKVHWIDPDTDLDCLAVRNPMGAWCGYVGLPPGHRFHGIGYDECTEKCSEDWCYEHSPNEAVEVHGGLTYSAACSESDEGEGFGICHVPLPGRPHDVWWLGFDCNHGCDSSPYDFARAAADPRFPLIPWIDGQVAPYRDLSYVKAECTSLARQLAKVSSCPSGPDTPPE